MEQFGRKDFATISEAYANMNEGVWDSTKNLAKKAGKGALNLTGDAIAGTAKAIDAELAELRNMSDANLRMLVSRLGVELRLVQAL